MSSERFLVTGAAGQDGSYLVERLVQEGVEVHGLAHTPESIASLAARSPEVIGHYGDVTDGEGIARLVEEIQPTHIINLAGITSVAKSWESPTLSAEILGVAPVRLLDAAWRSTASGREIRVVQASSAEIFGVSADTPQTEETVLAPVSPYGAAKAFAHTSVGVFRKRGLFAASAILYNHESPERPASFVSRKISQQVARISLGLSDRMLLGNLDAERDWGYAPDVVEGMLMIARADEARDYIVATGESHSVREFVAAAFRHVGIERWEQYVSVDPALLRPTEPGRQIGDPSRLRALGWQPTVDFEGLVGLMVDADIRLLSAN